MKNLLTLIIGCATLISFFSCQTTNFDYEKEKEEVLVRLVGHEILRYVGDSTQGLKPIKELDDHVYQIEFNGPFSFFSDSVINIIDEKMAQHLGNKEYLVKVQECLSEDVVFSYLKTPMNMGSVVPCMGRSQDENCYMVNIGFIKATPLASALPVFGTIALLLVGFLFYKRSNSSQTPLKDQAKSDDQTSETESLSLGRFGFNYDEQVLIFAKERIPLTYKEAKLLRILGENQGEVIHRESMQQQVWEDDGLMVSRSLDMFISKLRKKLKRDPAVEIKSIHGIGYKLIVS